VENGGGAPRARRRLGMGWAAIGAGLAIGLVVMLIVFALTR
jgi:hypothetical protein